MKGSALSWLKTKLAGPAREPVRLTVVPEDALLPPVADAAGAAEPPPFPGVLERAVESGRILAAELAVELQGAVAGDSIPAWASQAEDAMKFGVNLCRVPAVHYAPEFGAVIDAEGRVFHSTVREATFRTPDLALLPNTRMTADGAEFAPVDAPRHGSATVFMAWGGLTNYGHFLLDCLSGLTLAADRGLLRRFPPLAPPLQPWHRELLELAVDPAEGEVVEVSAPLVQVDDLLFTSCMDHFLHAPNQPLDSLRARILARAPAGDPQAGRRLYLTRRDVGKRILVNEAELEAALVERGFTVVQAERLSVAEQIALFRHAEVVVAPTGAALANVLFMPPGSKVFEIQPSNYTGIWVRMISRFVDVRWGAYFTSSPLPATPAEAADPDAVDWMFRWALPLDDFLAYLDARL